MTVESYKLSFIHALNVQEHDPTKHSDSGTTLHANEEMVLSAFFAVSLLGS